MRAYWCYPLWAVGVIAACQPKTVETPPPEAPPIAQPAAAPAGPKPEIGSFGIDLTERDPAVKLGDDFYRHVNGKWLDSYQLKPDEMRYGAFVKLMYRSEDRVKAIIDELVDAKPKPGTTEQQIADYFASFMDVAALDEKGIAPIQDALDEIAAIQSPAALVEAFGKSGLTETAAPMDAGVGIDREDPDRHMLSIGHSGLGLPDRDYYLEESKQGLLDAYEQYIATLLGFVGQEPKTAAKAAKKIVALETAIAKAHWPRTELRDVAKTRNVYTLAQFEKDFASYPWRKHLSAAGVDLAKVDRVNVSTPSALGPLAQLVAATPVATWKDYLTFHLVSNHAPLLSQTIDRAYFEFYGKTLGGQPEQRDRWKRSIRLIGDIEGLGEAIGKLYVERHFSADSKAQMLALVENLRAALRQRINGLDWMGPATKQAALAKLETFRPKIGYPDKWRDFSSIRIVPGDLMANYRAVRQYWYDDALSRLGKPTDRDEWAMTPQTINAYYNPQFNEIVFPAAVLQPPFFDPNADPAVNYGAIGGVIGHEMGHGFDDQGSQFDEKGVQRDWWTDADRKRFAERTAQLVEQYNAYEPLEGQPINGQLTLGENIGDLGGLSMALTAYRIALGGKPAPVLEGTTGEQRLFLSWAQLWKSKTREQLQEQLLKVDNHSPGEFRVNGVVRNIDTWYDAFGVGTDAALYLPPERRVRIW